MKRFTILGAGFLGLALAQKLKENYELKLSSSNNEKIQTLNDMDFSKVYLFNEHNLENLDQLLDTDYLFINYPPSKYEDYLGFLEKIYKSTKSKNIEKVIFISSTSIYPNIEGLLDETMKIETSVSQKVYDAENQVSQHSHLILRVSGLTGAQRLAGKSRAGKVLNTQDKKVNLVHRDDVIDAVIFSLEKDLEGIFNLCASQHPTYKELYESNAKKYGFETPIFKDKKEYKNRLIDGSKIESYGFEYKYPNPLTFKY